MNTGIDRRSALRLWVLRQNKTLNPDDLTDSTALIEQRIITSLQIMELLIFIQQLSGKEISIEDLRPGSFRNINTIHDTFFGVQHAGQSTKS